MTGIARRCRVDVTFDAAVVTVDLRLCVLVTRDAREICIRSRIGMTLIAERPPGFMFS
jgi:hypothetical protein